MYTNVFTVFNWDPIKNCHLWQIAVELEENNQLQHGNGITPSWH